MKQTNVVNIHHGVAYDVYIGRARKSDAPNIWGNPFAINTKTGDTREVVIEKHRKHLWNMLIDGTITVSELLSLKGKTLGCFCSPNPCHGDNYVKAIEFLDSFGITNDEQFRNWLENNPKANRKYQVKPLHSVNSVKWGTQLTTADSKGFDPFERACE